MASITVLNKGTITNPYLKLKPSKKLCSFIKLNLKNVPNLPSGIKNIIIDGKFGLVSSACDDHQNSFKDDDKESSVITEDTRIVHCSDSEKPNESSNINSETASELLTLKDLNWLYNYISTQDDKVYLHELLEGSEVILPENDTIPRSEELEKRCEKFRSIFANKEYDRITKSVRLGSRISEGSSGAHPDDSLAHVMKEMNRQMIAVFQFIVSVLTGFAFGFVGIELMIGSIPIGTRLLLGIFAALIIAVAELYFLLKQLDKEEIKKSA